MEGTIARIFPEKGYGFIRGADGVERFFHKSGLQRFSPDFDELREGQACEFTPIQGPKGPRAIEVRV